MEPDAIFRDEETAKPGPRFRPAVPEVALRPPPT